MGEIVNPYIAGAPVTEARMFFGREDVFQWIENSIAGQYADHILVIHGQRRVGKTSVLKQLGNRLPMRFIPVFFDLQGRTHTTLDRFLWWLAREIVRVLKQDREIEVPLPEKEAFASDLEYFEHRFLPDLRPLLKGSTLLLTFDEFDNLEQSEIKEELARPLIDYLRRLIGSPGLNFIFSIGSSGRKLENMQAAYTEFFKTALYKKISFLSEEQTRNLVTRPVEHIIDYDKHAVARIYQITGGHPYFTQLTCHELFAKCQHTDQRRIREPDVESVLDDVIERGTVNLKFVWDEASDIEKWGLAALAQLDKTDNRSLTEYLRKQRVRFSESDLTAGLLHLREKDILTPENRFVIHLMKLWLQKNRSMEQVREELTQVNPIANRYIEIGLEYKESKQYSEALESFQNALKVDTDNIQAQVSIGSVYLDQQAYEKAILEFEKALAIDDENITARVGLCEALLTIGDAARLRKRTNEAIQSYQRILTINAEHTEARQRVAEIHIQHAESALEDGRTDEALTLFLEALKFTPEDPDLIARVNEIQAKKRERELADLLARADAAVKLSHWDAALAALNEYIAVQPSEVDVQKLDETPGSQPEHLLDTLQTVARGLERSERFDDALQVWREVMALNPQAQQRIESEIVRIELKRDLENSYIEAKRALNQGDYALAAKLLKNIVVTDETYKDVLQLLARVTAKRSAEQRPLRRRWLWVTLGIFSIVFVVSLGIGYKLLNWGGATPTSTIESGGNIGTAISPTQVTATAGSAEKIRAFADPILTAIVNKTPDYQDDFSDPNSGWPRGTANVGSSGLGVGERGYIDGEYFLRASYLPPGQCCLDTTGGETPQFSDFVISVDVRFMSGNEGVWSVSFRRLPNDSPDTWFYSITFSPKGYYEISKNSTLPGVTLADGHAPVFHTGQMANHLEIVARGSQMAFYLNEEPLQLIQDDTATHGGIVFWMRSDTDTPLEARYDNLKVWDISGISLENSTDKIRSFADPILASIANKTPNYQDDFSNPNSGWPTDRNSTGNEFGYQDGAYLISNWRAKMTGEGSCNGVDLPSSSVFSDFVLEADGQFISQGEGAWTILFRINDKAHYGANISPSGKFWFHKNVNDIHTPLPQTESPISSFRSGNTANHLTLIAQGNQMAVYINGEPVAMLTDSSSSQGTIYLTVCDGNPLQVLVDNLKVWDISGISFETSADQIRSFANPILTAIANKTPDYQDDFNNPNSGWPDESTPDGDQWGYVERTYSLTVTRRYRNPTGDSCLDIKPNTEPQFSDFVWEASAQFVTDSPGSLHIFFRDMPPTSQHPIDTSYFMGLFPDGTFFLHKNLNTNQVNQINMVEGPFTPPLLTGTGKNRLLLIAQKSKMAVYANDQPLVLINDTTWQAGNIFLQFGACNNSESDTPLQVRFDDLKVWNITDLLP